MKYALIDTANTFFRARHVASRNSTPEEKIGMALHLTLASVNQAVRKYGIDHVVFCLEGRSFRKDLYSPYKKNRVVDAMSITEEEAEESKMFWETYEKFTTFIKDRTNVSVLRHERAEADELLANGCLNGLFVTGRSIGFIGHFIDQKRLKQGLYRHPWDDISYQTQL
jgi:5'-3' exonuclease